MKFRRTTQPTCRDEHTRAGFTFAEVLAALLFMAIVIPAAIEGVRIANLAGQVSARKTVATRIAQNYLTELKVTGQWQRGAQNGSVQEGGLEYHWTASLEPWSQVSRSTAHLRLLTVRVSFLVQGREYDVRVSTLIDTTLT